MDKIYEKVKKILIENFLKEENVKLGASLKDDLGLDSLDKIEFMMALEEEFNLEISDKDGENIKTVHNVVQYLEMVADKKEREITGYGRAWGAVQNDINKQVKKQLQKWGIQKRSFLEWERVLNEELAEMATEVIVAKKSGYKELIHSVAVAVAWLVDLQIRGRNE